MELNQTEKPTRQIDRVALDADSLKIIDHWILQITERRKGIHLSRKNVLNWLIQRQNFELSKNEEKDLVDKFYDEEKLLKSILKDVQLARLRGEKIKVEEYLFPGSKGTHKVKTSE